ncbi:sulfurtransferase [Corynebacterium mendelii]|uniref:Sulfurtransferase n=1 Tax=Corynebacterium mendelii TaxID=2765362 RepID=A0A939IXX3_9CORY|nr:sulfurtransferase [Corynebacterium mendelii]MBN9644513.1 sulfurtransferase [Corynebacterium mendelii]
MTVPFDPHPAFADYAHPDRLVSASWLSARLGIDGLKVVESDADALLYDIGHIPGAVRIDWRRDLNDPVTRDFIDGEQFAALMNDKGIAKDDTVVIYGDQSNWWAAFTFWVFTMFGHEDVRLLNGGRDAWMAEERDTSFVVPDYPPTNYPVPVRDDSTHRIFCTDLLDNIGRGTIVDVRLPEEYTGESNPDDSYGAVATMRGGHIPTAVSVPWRRTVHPNGRFKSREDLDKLYAQAGADPTKPTVVYCRLGERSALTWFVLTYLLGWPAVRNYDGSWAEWGNMVRMPVTRGSEPGDMPGSAAT